ncbi:B3 domain-containing protein At5g42700-like [Papaver somniferum]|uniref:B3 domain-containing protein At5g42700-like n=1 Tax=Papaver somniferum TaxID=3469 RepID=UPI000E705F47|nr:B3 domain-containing protein At5g42700-like [Papaver somniferum]
MATEEEIQIAAERAQQFQLSLGGAVPSFVKCMLPSHVSGGFWLGLPRNSCEDHLPNHDVIITLVDLQGVRFETRYMSRKRGLCGGWRSFALQHNLIHGDALVFELTEPTVFRVHIFRAGDV